MRGKLKFILPVAGVLVVLVIVISLSTARKSSSPAAGANPDAPAPFNRTDDDIAFKVDNFLGGLKAGGTPESAGHERTYVVVTPVAFLRKTPDGKLKEESIPYRQLTDCYDAPPCVFYGEDIVGRNDAAHPEAISVRAAFDKKQYDGFVDSARLWLEPPLDAAGSDRYMITTPLALVRVVPDQASPSVLDLLQGEVVETVGQINFKGSVWIKARFNVTERVRYGFLPASDVKALTTATVNESQVGLEEVPQKVRNSKYAFSASDRQKLAQNGFYVEPVPPVERLYVDDFVDAYRRESSNQLFVTTDLYLHAFHLIFDRMLQDVEEKKILPAVASMAESLARTAESQVRSSTQAPPAVRDALLSDLLYFAVAARLFNPDFKVPDAVKPQAEVFLSKIQSASGELPSGQNFLGFDKEDFTQYKVRGHYEKSDALRQYFRGMMWFGRRNFLLSKDHQTLAAILLPNIVESAQQTRQFEAIDGAIRYLIGVQDKYTLEGYRTVNRKVFGTATPGPGQMPAALDQSIAAFRQAAWSDLPQPQIVSVQTGTGLTQEERLHQSAGLKFLGQRYVLDAYLLQQLTSPSVGSDRNPRNLPSALDVMAVLGSRAAGDLQQQAQQKAQWAGYDQQMEKLKQTAEGRLARRGTFYEEWLYAIKTLFAPAAGRQMFALSGPWQYKNLNAGLASWTELKHDTLLYTEQSNAEMGGGSDFSIPPYDPPRPKGYVEPNPALFHQLVKTVDELLSELQRKSFISDEYVDKFLDFRKLAQRAEVIAQKEVAGERITREDYEWIISLPESGFEPPLLLPRNAEIKDPSELRMALVADVATDAVSGKALEEGIGTPQKIVVVVKDIPGGTRQTFGYVYSWYEFAGDRRWNDTEWKQIIYGGEDKKRAQGIVPPAWYSVFLRGSGEK